MRMTTILAAGLATLFLASPAWAYLDPSTGSMIISAIVGVFASVALAVRTYWYRIKALFRRDTKNTTPASEDRDA